MQQRFALLATCSASFHIGGKSDDAFEAGVEFRVDGAGRAAYETFYGDSLIGGVGLRHWGVGGSGGWAHGIVPVSIVVVGDVVSTCRRWLPRWLLKHSMSRL